VDSKEFIAFIDGVGPIWKGTIPTKVEFPLGSYSQKLEFPIEGILPFSTLSNRATGVQVEFEIWADIGKKIESTTIYSWSWNPVGPKTLVSMRISDDDIGTHTMIVRTIYEVSTTGLLTRYLKQEIKIPFQILAKKQEQKITFGTLKDRTISEGSFTLHSFDVSSSVSSQKVAVSSLTPEVCTIDGTTVKLLATGKCILQGDQVGNDKISAAMSVQTTFNIQGSKPSSIGNMTGSYSGSTLSYTFSKPSSSPVIDGYEVGIQALLAPSLSKDSLFSYGPITIIKTSLAEAFSLTASEVEAYLTGRVPDISSSSIMVRVRSSNSLGYSDWGNGIYFDTSRLGFREKAAAEKAAAEKAAAEKAAKKRKSATIICTKGKITMKIISMAVNPTCPTGYKKK
jgi:hypothetical protein